MIRAASWFCADCYGVLVPGGHSWQRPSPAASATAEILALIGRPVKYFGRLTTESRFGMCAAGILIREMQWTPSEDEEIGLISSSPDGCLRDNQEYFGDYVQSGRTLGRGNLFIYTLPTSVAGEIAIALSLTGPTLFVKDDIAPLAGLVRHAEHLIADGEADHMLVLWSDWQALVCLAVDASTGVDPVLATLVDSTPDPMPLLRQFQTRIQQA
jgi:3-oxoacyl-(acyl-carrier-protein) synthase